MPGCAAGRTTRCSPVGPDRFCTFCILAERDCKERLGLCLQLAVERRRSQGMQHELKEAKERSIAVQKQVC